MDAHGCAVGFAVGDERETRVVRNVQRLVRVRGPRVGQFVPSHEVACAFRSACPQTERAVDVNPSPLLVSQWDGGREIVERTRVHIAGLQGHDRRPVVGGKCVGQSVDPDSALLVGCDRFGCAETQVPQRQVHRVVAFLADEDPHPGRPLQTVRLYVPTGRREDRVASRRQVR